MKTKDQELLICYLNEVIVANNFSQKDIAKHLDLAEVYVSRLRSGVVPISKKTIKNLEKIHSISLEEYGERLRESSIAHLLKRIKENPLVLNAIKSNLNRHK